MDSDDYMHISVRSANWLPFCRPEIWSTLLADHRGTGISPPSSIKRFFPPRFDSNDIETTGFFANRRRLRHSVVESAATLLACALTCREWLPRSIFNLYSVCVVLEDSKSVDRLVDLMAVRPHLAGFVRILWVSPEEFRSPRNLLGLPLEQYIPFARAELVHKLRNLHTIAYLGRFRWPYPGSCNLRIAQYRSLRTLYLDSRFPSPVEMFRLIWTLEGLRHLHLHRARFDSCPDASGSLGPAYERLQYLAVRRPRCKSLESLMIDWDSSGVPAGVPYESAFGTSVLRLGLSYDWRTISKLYEGSRISNYISNLASLEELSLLVRITRPTESSQMPPDIQKLASWLQDTVTPLSCRRLQRIHIQVQDLYSGQPNPVYEIFNPDNHLDHVFNRIPELRELAVQFDYVREQSAQGPHPPDPYEAISMYKALLCAMPGLKAKLSVVVNGQICEQTLRAPSLTICVSLMLAHIANDVAELAVAA
ncbi:hypothetical protein NUW54_g10039 [Trametes sanguinea]|uniref:Uncharacterized protein n=1 Tax=Trametes sanguinea TaxID=158606 RepID=A0ACC1P375_9APHY|nr:hypothetical protein NUW54_g10039 [Trametes sanguinea]